MPKMGGGEIVKTAVIIEDDEIIEHRELMQDEEITVIKKKKELNPGQIKIINQKCDLKKRCDKLGGFVNMLCVRNKLLFNNTDIDRADISRLIYLATFTDYNNRQENLLIYHKKGKPIMPMTRAQMKKILKLSENTFNVFMKNIKDAGLIWKVNGRYYISNKYFTKGKVDFNSKEYTRIFIDTTQYLYNHCTPRQHKMLGYVFQLIPYSHYELNVICRKPMEVNVNEIKKLSLQEICELLEISTNKGNMVKFRNNLSKFYINVEGNKYYIFAHVTVKTGIIRDYFVINPAISWAGNNANNMQNTIKSLYFG